MILHTDHLDEEKQTKPALGEKKVPQIQANIKMATKRNHAALKYLTNYILKTKRLRKTFVKFWTNAQE